MSTNESLFPVFGNWFPGTNPGDFAATEEFINKVDTLSTGGP